MSAQSTSDGGPRHLDVDGKQAMIMWFAEASCWRTPSQTSSLIFSTPPGRQGGNSWYGHITDAQVITWQHPHQSGEGWVSSQGLCLMLVLLDSGCVLWVAEEPRNLCEATCHSGWWQGWDICLQSWTMGRCRENQKMKPVSPFLSEART